MLVYGAQRTKKHSGTVLLNIIVSVCTSFIAYLVLGQFIVGNSEGGLVGSSTDLE